ncbi:MAG: metallophosphoesterase family protein [Leucobacter sp.]|nr:metallophosphoesterase family protein [Leucobacter sp.]
MSRPSLTHRSRKRAALSLATGTLIATVGLTALGGGVAAAAGGGRAPPAVDPASIHAPTSRADRIVLTPTATPATSQFVSWRTTSDVGTGRVQIAPSTVSLPLPSATFDATKSDVFDSNLGYQVKHHTALLEGLTPDTSYLYRVGDGESWTEWFEFRTAANSVGAFSFIVQGDGQNDNKAYTSRIYRAAFEARPHAQLVVHAGDLIDTDNADNEWGEWHEASGFANQYVNLIATPGNHEYYPGPGLTNYWQAGFEFPANGPAAEKFNEVTYSVDYQGVRFISLDSNLAFNTNDRAAQTEWLEGVLENNPNKWTVVTFHHPVFAVTSGRNNQVIRDAWLPLFEEHGVDLVVQGHDHAYGRGHLFDNEAGFENGEHDGTVYLVSVAGPKMYVADPEDNNNWVNNGANRKVVHEDLQLYQTVDVTEGQMHVQSRTVTGEVKDSFTIVKNDAGDKSVADAEPWAAGPGSARGGVQITDPTGPTIPGDGEPGDGEPGDGEPGDGDGEPGDGDGEPTEAQGGLSDTEVVAGGTVGVTGVGFDAHETVIIELHSTPVELARLQANAAGEISTRVVIPANTTPGSHHIVLTGAGSGAVVTLPLEVRAAAGGATDGTSGLSNTGAEIGGLVATGVILLVVGAGLIIRARRKSNGVTE